MTAEAYARGSQATSAAAYDALQPSLDAIRGQCLEALKVRPQTSFELAQTLGLPFENVQPRCSELLKAGDVENSGRRGPARSGPNKATVWKAREV